MNKYYSIHTDQMEDCPLRPTEDCKNPTCTNCTAMDVTNNYSYDDYKVKGGGMMTPEEEDRLAEVGTFSRTICDEHMTQEEAEADYNAPVTNKFPDYVKYGDIYW